MLKLYSCNSVFSYDNTVCFSIASLILLKYNLHLERLAYKGHTFRVMFEFVVCMGRKAGHVGGLATDDVFAV